MDFKVFQNNREFYINNDNLIQYLQYHIYLFLNFYQKSQMQLDLIKIIIIK